MDQPLSAKRKREDEDYRGEGRYDRRYDRRDDRRDRYRGGGGRDRGRHGGYDRRDRNWSNGGRRDRHGGGGGRRRHGGGRRGGMPPRGGRQNQREQSKLKHQVVSCVKGVVATNNCAEDDPEYVIQQLLVKVGDTISDKRALTPEEFTTQLGEHLPGLAEAASEDIEKNPDMLAANLLTCASQIPLKVPLYGTLAGLFNVDNKSFGLLLLKTAAEDLQHALVTLPKSKRRARLLLLYIGEMVNSRVLEPVSFVQLIENLIPRESGESTSSVRSDLLVYLALSSLPWVGQTLQEKCPDAFDRFLTSAGAYMQKRKSFAKLTAFSNAADTDLLLASNDELRSLLANIRSAQGDENQWRTPAIHRGWEICAEEIAEGTEDTALHTLPEVEIDVSEAAGVEDEVFFALPAPRLNICTRDNASVGLSAAGVEEAGKVEDLPQMTKMLCHHHIRDILRAFVPDHKEAAEQLTNWLGVMDVDASKELIILESYFSILLAQPATDPDIPVAYMYTVLINLARAQPHVVPKRLAQTVLMLYYSIDRMAVGAVDALSSWLAHFVSNFDYTWPWQKFVDVCDTKTKVADAAEGDVMQVVNAIDPSASRRMFVRAVLEKAVRLSYPSRVGGVFKDKESYAPLLQFLPQDPKYHSKYLAYADTANEGDQAVPEGVEICKSIAAKIESKTPDADMLAWLDEQMPPDQTTVEFRVQVWMHALLSAGRTSYSHLHELIAQYKSVMVSLKNAEGEGSMISSLAETWSSSTQAQLVILDKFLGMKLVAPEAVIRWVFRAEMIKRFDEFTPWEFLHLALSKGLQRISALEASEKAKAMEIEGAEGMEGEAVMHKSDVSTAVAEAKKALFLIVFQRLCMVLTEHLQEGDGGDGEGEGSNWFKATMARFLQIGTKYAAQFRPILGDIEQSLPDLHASVQTIFDKIKLM